MDCPACHTSNPSGQKYCGSCGRSLELQCPGCGAPNPPQYKFCGQCGTNLAETGTIILASSGLITRANSKALALLGYRNEEVEGKPFSLFVEREDLVVFYSHWNELRSSSKRQSFEIALKHKEGKNLYLRLDFELNTHDGGNPSEVRGLLNEITEHRKVSAQMQFQEDLLNLVFTTADALHTASDQHLDRSIQDALKKLCLVTEADRSFIFSFNRRLKSADPAYKWCKASAEDDASEFKSVPLAILKGTIDRLRQEPAYVVDDVAGLTPPERNELLAWHQDEPGAVACQLIYCSKRPVGIIGISKRTAGGNWDPHCIAMVKFLGQLLADRLPFANVKPTSVEDAGRQSKEPAPSRPAAHSKKTKVIDITKKRFYAPTDPGKSSRKGTGQYPLPDPSEIKDVSRPMLIEKSAG